MTAILNIINGHINVKFDHVFVRSNTYKDIYKCIMKPTPEEKELTIDRGWMYIVALSILLNFVVLLSFFIATLTVMIIINSFLCLVVNILIIRYTRYYIEVEIHNDPKFNAISEF